MKRLSPRVLAATVALLASGPVHHLPAAQFRNVSSAAFILSGDNVLIGGFIITGAKPKKVIVRAVAPSIDYIPELNDTVLELHQRNGSVLTNDNWRDTQAQAVIDTGLAPPHDLDSAIVATLPPGNYTVVAHGKGNAVGAVLAEAYDLDQTAKSEFANVSARGFVNSMSNNPLYLIARIIVGSDRSGDSTVVVRGLGGSLAAYGISTPLIDPLIELYNSDGVMIDRNDNWMDDPNAFRLITEGLAPSNPLEAVFQATLAPGTYAALLRGNGRGLSATGIGLIETYNIK